MRAILAAIAACLMLAATPAQAEPPSHPDRSWHRTGFYVGVAGGYDIAQMQAETFKFADASLMGGGLVGVQVRLPDIVVGIEADYMFVDVKASLGGGSPTLTASASFLASVRARVGVPVGPALFYITGGPAFTENKLAVAGSADKEFLTGGVVGGGVEAELTRTLFVRLEGLHYMFPDKDVTLTPVGLFESQNQQTTVRLGVGFRLN